MNNILFLLFLGKNLSTSQFGLDWQWPEASDNPQSSKIPLNTLQIVHPKSNLQGKTQTCFKKPGNMLKAFQMLGQIEFLLYTSVTGLI